MLLICGSWLLGRPLLRGARYGVSADDAPQQGSVKSAMSSTMSSATDISRSLHARAFLLRRATSLSCSPSMVTGNDVGVISVSVTPQYSPRSIPRNLRLQT